MERSLSTIGTRCSAAIWCPQPVCAPSLQNGWPVSCPQPSHKFPTHPEPSRGGTNGAPQKRTAGEGATEPAGLLGDLQMSARHPRRGGVQRDRPHVHRGQTVMGNWAMAHRERTRRGIERGAFVRKAGMAQLLRDDAMALVGASLPLAGRLRAAEKQPATHPAPSPRNGGAAASQPSMPITNRCPRSRKSGDRRASDDPLPCG